MDRPIAAALQRGRQRRNIPTNRRTPFGLSHGYSTPAFCVPYAPGFSGLWRGGFCLVEHFPTGLFRVVHVHRSFGWRFDFYLLYHARKKMTTANHAKAFFAQVPRGSDRTGKPDRRTDFPVYKDVSEIYSEGLLPFAEKCSIMCFTYS